MRYFILFLLKSQIVGTVLKSIHNLCFAAKITMKIMYTPANLQFTIYVKGGEGSLKYTDMLA